jgi:dienelactone hydrolase
MRYQPYKRRFIHFLLLSFLLFSALHLSVCSPATPRFQIEPAEELFGVSVSIKIAGLKAGESVTIHAHSKDGQSLDWESTATFTADKKGIVDVEKQAPVSGDYTVADPLGLLWSMKPVNLKGKNPPSYEFQKLDHIAIHLTAERASGNSLTADIKRYFRMPGIELTRIPIEKEGLEGTLFHPSQGGPHPGLILLAGSGGGIYEWWAELMASNGFAALTLPYFRYKDLPKELMEIPLEYFKEAIAWLKEQKAVDGSRIAAMGASKGGELALLLGATYPEIKAVIACVPSSVVWQGISRDRLGSSWSQDGKGLPFAQWHFSPEDAQKMEAGQPLSLLETYSLKKNDPVVLAKAAIPVEKIKGPILMVSGTDDQLWPSTQFANMVMERLEKYNHPHERQHLCYQGAGHLVFLPYFITSGNRIEMPFMNGGNPRADANGSADFWAKMLDFLHKHLDK